MRYVIDAPFSVSLLGLTVTSEAVVPGLGALGPAALVNCFAALTQCYLERVRHVVEMDLTKELLDERLNREER